MLVVVIQGDVLTTTNIIALNNGLHLNKYICLDWRILNFNQMYLFESHTALLLGTLMTRRFYMLYLC